jgi:hypothetical protein
VLQPVVMRGSIAFYVEDFSVSTVYSIQGAVTQAVIAGSDRKLPYWDMCDKS